MLGWTYLSMNGKNIFTADWQVWVLLDIILGGIVAVLVVVWKTRKL